MSTENQEQKAYREQYFSEMNDQDKIKFLVRELHRTQLALASVSNVVNRLEEHKHCDGKVVYELRGRSGIGMMYQSFMAYEHWY